MRDMEKYEHEKEIQKWTNKENEAIKEDKTENNHIVNNMHTWQLWLQSESVKACYKHFIETIEFLKMGLKLNSKLFVITGSAGGLGKAFAVKLLSLGSIYFSNVVSLN